jgi:hypothetical protein
MKIIFLFIDGFGIGQDDKSKNPVIAANTPNIDYMFGRYEVVKPMLPSVYPGFPRVRQANCYFYRNKCIKGSWKALELAAYQYLKKIIYKNNLLRSF